MADTTYTPPKVWTHDAENGGTWASINRPTAGAREEKELPRGEHPFQLYSLGTPNGQKVTILFEELLAAGVSEAEYDAWLVNIGEGTQFTSGFVEINPNSKIPALLDCSGETPVRVFESGAILFHLAEKFGMFLPKDGAARTECMSWLMWQMSTAPIIGGGFGHFYAYAPEKFEYPINRFAMETKRIMDVADKRLAETRYLAGDDYTIADIAAYGWLGGFVRGESYTDAATFLSVHEYTNLMRWGEELGERTGVKRGLVVNRDAPGKIKERHSAADIDAVLGA
ncbi:MULTISPECIES: glutathione-dependent disulfide-bond oxidoreductase [Novosphingobium]|uniref:Glutathione-dependent disulfide-bond oxidoreductase n=1 Tax=Novosphingobium decolorationis TaxID=2698673 RepID=A0ABX8E8Y3_9SPHN|nr:MULTISPECIES: glutathione-dependent disulfide-bond oxidoreductase [Novosphingobium]MED5546931.1 glutathione-dependent disulfide-bond oxidoreductase [Pseudomonadota bacterium]QVM85651.1 glutathione-dependent disulfide-bond oxidoreductase [Novosphingobium decolorationis]GAM07399.1 glutathione S-transferase YghU [Novosphingobium sp. MBES04]